MRIIDALLDEQGRIDPARWRVALRDGSAVGTCECGAPAVAVAADAGRSWGRTFHEAECTDCRAEAVIPATRVVRDPSMVVVPGLGELLMDAARERDAAILGEREREPAYA